MIIAGFEKYMIYKDGTVVNSKSGRAVRPWRTSNGYKSVTLFNNKKPYGRRVHKLLAQTFLNLPCDKYITFLDGNRENIDLDNLCVLDQHPHFNNVD